MAEQTSPASTNRPLPISSCKLQAAHLLERQHGAGSKHQRCRQSPPELSRQGSNPPWVGSYVWAPALALLLSQEIGVSSFTFLSVSLSV